MGLAEEFGLPGSAVQTWRQPGRPERVLPTKVRVGLDFFPPFFLWESQSHKHGNIKAKLVLRAFLLQPPTAEPRRTQLLLWPLPGAGGTGHPGPPRWRKEGGANTEARSRPGQPPGTAGQCMLQSPYCLGQPGGTRKGVKFWSRGCLSGILEAKLLLVMEDSAAPRAGKLGGAFQLHHTWRLLSGV